MLTKERSPMKELVNFPGGIRTFERDIPKQLNFKLLKLFFMKNYIKIEKQNNISISPLVCVVTKIKHHIIFIRQNNLFRNMLIYCFCHILEISIMF